MLTMMQTPFMRIRFSNIFNQYKYYLDLHSVTMDVVLYLSLFLCVTLVITAQFLYSDRSSPLRISFGLPKRTPLMMYTLFMN